MEPTASPFTMTVRLPWAAKKACTEGRLAAPAKCRPPALWGALLGSRSSAPLSKWGSKQVLGSQPPGTQ